MARTLTNEPCCILIRPCSRLQSLGKSLDLNDNPSVAFLLIFLFHRRKLLRCFFPFSLSFLFFFACLSFFCLVSSLSSVFALNHSIQLGGCFLTFFSFSLPFPVLSATLMNPNSINFSGTLFHTHILLLLLPSCNLFNLRGFRSTSPFVVMKE